MNFNRVYISRVEIEDKTVKKEEIVRELVLANREAELLRSEKYIKGEMIEELRSRLHDKDHIIELLTHRNDELKEAVTELTERVTELTDYIKSTTDIEIDNRVLKKI